MIRNVVLVSLMLVIVQGETSAATVLRLRETATVRKPLVTLGDLAEIKGNDPRTIERYAGLELFPAPRAGESTWLDLMKLKDLLYRKGVRLDSIQFAGPRRIEIRSETLPETIAGRNGASSHKRWQTIITTMLRQNILQTGKWTDEELQLQVQGERAFDFLERSRSDQWELIPPTYWRLGAQAVTLEVPSVSDTSRFMLGVVIQVKQRIVIARRQIRRGEVISIDDVDTIYQTRASSNEPWFDDIEMLLGQKAIRTLVAGKPIAKRDVKAVPVVFRNDPITVTIYVRSRPIVQFDCIAREEGGVGAWIEVVNAVTKKRLDSKVRVTGPRQAELPDNAPVRRVRATGVAARRRPRGS